MTQYPNIDKEIYPDFVINVQKLNDDDLLHLLNLFINDWVNISPLKDHKSASGQIEVITNEIQIRTGSLKYEICCECGCAVPLNRLNDHPIICGDYTKHD